MLHAARPSPFAVLWMLPTKTFTGHRKKSTAVFVGLRLFLYILVGRTFPLCISRIVWRIYYHLEQQYKLIYGLQDHI